MYGIDLVYTELTDVNVLKVMIGARNFAIRLRVRDLI